MMAATLAYYEHLVERHLSRKYFTAWDKRLQAHRQWLRSQKHLA